MRGMQQKCTFALNILYRSSRVRNIIITLFIDMVTSARRAGRSTDYKTKRPHTQKKPEINLQGTPSNSVTPLRLRVTITVFIRV